MLIFMGVIIDERCSIEQETLDMWKKKPINSVLRTFFGIKPPKSSKAAEDRGWGSSDFNAPDEALCHSMMDRAILDGGVNLVALASSKHYTRPPLLPRSG